MNIVIDIRPLIHGNESGVEVYMVNLLRTLFQIDQKNRYILYYNSFRNVQSVLPKFDFPNVSVVRTRYPNKLLNLLLAVFRWPKIDRLALKAFLVAKSRLSIVGRFSESPRFINTIKENSNVHSDSDFHADIVFVPDPRPSPVSPGVRKITTFHDLSFLHFPHFFTWKTRLWHRLVQPKREANESARIIAVSNFTKSELVKYFRLPENRIQVIYHGIDEKFGSNFSNKEKNFGKDEVCIKYALPEQFFLCVSTIEPRKNLENLIKAFRAFKKKNNVPHSLVIVGKRNKRIFREVSLDDKFHEIHFTGFVPSEDKEALYKMARGLIHVSMYEGFGFPVLEAMKAGIPVVASKIPPFEEILGPEGIFVDPNDIESIASGIERILDEPFAKQYACHLQSRASTFIWERAVRKTLRVFRLSLR